MQINWSQVFTSLFIGAVIGVISFIRFSDSQAIVVAGHTTTLNELKASSVSRPEYEATILRIDQRLQSIDEHNKEVSSTLTELLRQERNR